jgi:hypothetical protein
MTPERFEEFDNHFMHTVSSVLHAKGLHYTEGEDRFSNFREAAKLGGTEPLDEMLAALRKHVIAFFTMFKRYRDVRIPTTMFVEHGGDIINYIRLINGHLKEGVPDYVSCDLPDCSCHIPGELCISPANQG